ncbi:disulfide bond formation protein B [Herbaspirillum robiniae]|uniref:disulfide bond formation protein B n=1 Tax=Herbaspirillum robiniae TaxID=2014887 RepID=UPI003D7752D7
MKSSRSILLAIAALCIVLFATALYLQAARDVPPCPLCIVQRYLLATLALTCGCFACLDPRLHKVGAAAGLCLAIGGIGIAARHLWQQNRLDAFCDVDPLEKWLNAMPSAQLLPLLFKADEGLCAMPTSLLGMSLPQWSLLGFIVIALGLLRYLARQEPLVPWLA